MRETQVKFALKSVTVRVLLHTPTARLAVDIEAPGTNSIWALRIAQSMRLTILELALVFHAIDSVLALAVRHVVEVIANVVTSSRIDQAAEPIEPTTFDATHDDAAVRLHDQNITIKSTCVESQIKAIQRLLQSFIHQYKARNEHKEFDNRELGQLYELAHDRKVHHAHEYVVQDLLWYARHTRYTELDEQDYSFVFELRYALERAPRSTTTEDVHQHAMPKG